MKYNCWGMCKEQHSSFVFTEVFGCGEIGKIFIESYLQSGVNLEKFPIHVFGYSADLAEIPMHPNVIKINLGLFRKQPYRFINSISIKKAYRRGHAGTALTWLLVFRATKAEKIIHIDSDTILLGDVVSVIDSKLDIGFDLVGPRRPYKNNIQGVTFDYPAQDLVQTCIFGFRPNKINRQTKLIDAYRMILGTFNPTGLKTLDFFDPVSQEILGDSGKPFFLDFDLVGGLNEFGSRHNVHAALNDFPTLRKIDVGTLFIHFSAVGSGINVYKNPTNNVPRDYAEYALDRFALYSHIFFNEDLGRDISRYQNLINGVKNLLKTRKFA